MTDTQTEREPMTVNDIRYMDCGQQVYMYDGQMAWTIARLEFFDPDGNELTWRETPSSCRVHLVIPKRDLSDGKRRKAGERLAEGSFAVVYTKGLDHMFKQPPPRKPLPLVIPVDDEHDEIFLPEGYHYHGAFGSVW